MRSFITKPLARKKGHILLVEDDALLASTEVRLLKKLGYSVTLVPTGEEAIEEMDSSAEKIDLILMDIDLGEGIDGTRAAQAILGSHDVPVLFLSGQTEPDTVDKAGEILSYGYVVKGSGLSVLDASIKMAFRLHRANMELKAKERDLRLFSRAMESSGNAIAISGPDTRLLYVNPAFLKMWGYSDRGDVIGKPAVRFWQEEERASFVVQVVNSKGGWSGELNAVSRDGAVFTVDVNTSIVTDDGNIPVGIIASFTDNTARKMADETAIETEARYRNIFDNALEGIFQTTPDGRYLNVNPAFARMFGYSSPEEMIISVKDIGKEIYVDPAVRDELKNILAHQEYIENYEARVYRKDRSEFWISINARTVRDRNGEIHHYEGTNIDITERKTAGDCLEKLVKEKDLLINETGERVKNNLDAISTLIHLESSRLSDKSVKMALDHIMERITSMSAVYEQLYAVSEVESVNLSSYCDSLVKGILKSGPIKTRRVNPELSVAEIRPGLKQTISIGLILNDLITLSLRNAAMDEESVDIHIDIKEAGGEVLFAFTSEAGPSAGDKADDGSDLAFVRTTAEQLGGSVKVLPGQGINIEIRFRV